MKAHKLGIALMVVFWSVLSQAETKRIALIAGKPSHGPGDHEFRAGVLLWQACLAETPGIEVETYFDGWPESDDALEDVAAVVIYADGGGKHPAVQANRIELLDRLAAKGVGIGCAHYGVEVLVGDSQKAMWRWIGGAYEHEYSVNPMWEPVFEDFPKHPITRGVGSFALLDEWYFNMRWDPAAKGVTPILTDAPSDDVRDGPYVYPKGPYQHIVEASGRKETMMWVVERPDGGRGFGFTGGHKHVNWIDDNQRKVVLNAILWIAKVDIPEKGVLSEVSAKQIAKNLDVKEGGDRIPQIAGDWRFEVSTGRGEGVAQFTFVQAGKNFLGQYSGVFGSDRPLSGQVDEKSIRFEVNGIWEGSAAPLYYEGNVAEDGGLKGTLSIGLKPQLTGTWTAARSR